MMACNLVIICFWHYIYLDRHQQSAIASSSVHATAIRKSCLMKSSFDLLHVHDACKAHRHHPVLCGLRWSRWKHLPCRGRYGSSSTTWIAPSRDFSFDLPRNLPRTGPESGLNFCSCRAPSRSFGGTYLGTGWV